MRKTLWLALGTLLLVASTNSAAQVLRPDLMYCGSSQRTGANLYLGVGPFNEVSSCTPTATTQALLVSRSGSYGGQGAAWLDYLNNGGVIITEWTISEDVYNELYGTAYPEGTSGGGCYDNAMPSLKFDPSGPFWTAVQIPETPSDREGCGRALNAIVDGEAEVFALGGWVTNGLVNFATRSQGSGVLYLLDADWQDNEQWFSDDSRLFMGALISGATGDAVQGTARFLVTKTFSDGSEGDVEVTLTCNSGLPLEQSFTISGGGPGVTFVVTDLPDSGADCEVTEAGGHDNYTSVMNGGVGCEWAGVTGGFRSCRIVNEANPATYTVTKDWVIQDERLNEVDYSVDVSIVCDSDILAVGGVSTYVGSSTTVSLSGADSVDVMVETLFGPANCYAEEDIVQSGVESEGSDECSGAELTAGGSAECVFTNTVFFEGIPTLSQYGMALMALLMLGVGFIGFRRFV